MRPQLGLLAALLVLAACDVPFVEREVQGVWDPEGSDYWDLPMPSDQRREVNGTFDLEDYPRARESDLLADWFAVADRRLDGWGLTSGSFHRFSGPLDASSLPSTPAASLAPDASVFLLDIDPSSPERGRRFPLWTRVLDAHLDRYTPEHLLAAIPVFGFVRRPRTEYALVVTTDLRDASGAAVGRSRAFHQAFEDQGGPEEARALLKHLRETLDAEGFELERVAAAASFTTLDPEAPLLALARWAETLPAPALAGGWTLVEDHDEFQVLRATLPMPVIQTGERPYRAIGEGLIQRGPDGNPEIVEMQDTRLLLSVPKVAASAEGYPLVLHLHGSGGSAQDSIDRGPILEDRPRDEQPTPAKGTGPAKWLARRGVASVAIDFPLHGIRHSPPDTSGLLLYNIFGNIGATIDNFMVSAMEMTIVSRLLVGLEVPLSEVSTATTAGLALAASDGVIRFDPEALTAMGQSMGSTIGTPWATVDPRVKGIILSGAGGNLVDIANHAIEPVPVKGIAEIALNLTRDEKELHLFHPALHAAQNLWDLVDPVAVAHHVTKEPHAGIPPKHVLMTAGYRDGYFAPTSQAAMAVSLGVPLVGEAVEPVLADTLALAGRESASFPLTNNLNGRTAGVLHYLGPNVNGHYVVFNQEGARFQYTCFAATMGRVEGPTLFAAQSLDAPCE